MIMWRKTACSAQAVLRETCQEQQILNVHKTLHKYICHPRLFKEAHYDNAVKEVVNGALLLPFILILSFKLNGESKCLHS